MQSTDLAVATATSPEAVAASWFRQAQEALQSADTLAFQALFAAEATMRDLLTLSWDFRNAAGLEEISTLIEQSEKPFRTSLAFADEIDTAFFGGDQDSSVQAFTAFTTPNGSGSAYVELVRREDGIWRAAALALALQELNSHPIMDEDNRPTGRFHGPEIGRRSFADRLDKEFESTDPDVVILGAGHNGLILAARLKAMGIRALILETNDRVGDNWRKRYSSLALHTPLVSDQFPYMPFPTTWPRETPKDKLADFMESYATLMDLSVWTKTYVDEVRFNETSGQWCLQAVRSDGSRRHLRVRHVVLATGNNAEAIRPQLQDRDQFHGEVIHAVDYRGWQEWTGKKVVVVGTGVSGHDIAQDLAEHGVDVTLIQRSPTVVVDIATIHETLYANHTGGQFTVEQSDLINASTAFGLLPAKGPAQRELAESMDSELLEGLRKAGFRLGDGPNGEGVLGLIYRQNTTGYYYNVGGSELIADGSIKLAHGSVEGCTPTGIRLADGTTVEADLVVFATGYRGIPTAVRNVLGDEAAERFKEVADFGSDREFGRLYRNSGQQGLWFMYSLSIADTRFYSTLLALQVAAETPRDTSD